MVKGGRPGRAPKLKKEEIRAERSTPSTMEVGGYSHQKKPTFESGSTLPRSSHWRLPRQPREVVRDEWCVETQDGEA